jgi:hypothetical protein
MILMHLWKDKFTPNLGWLLIEASRMLRLHNHTRALSNSKDFNVKKKVESSN